ncbi:hypothetical protein FOMG_19191 [Fusarium oxysporum f. sp. melonis 26406]|uniref:Uncharacterized protein n=1 Tax=Fusarium oxysporum f. sp. melonis 26406 TaxID=1089452 RepID=W9Z651_FUSOX|nr:hypothetical protein FOMG_19191 [Fusarium oxysporum f. sp. melonis 26406]
MRLTNFIPIIAGPEDVCLRVSGTRVCGTTEVSQGCDLTLRRDGTGGAVTYYDTTRASALHVRKNAHFLPNYARATQDGSLRSRITVIPSNQQCLQDGL